MSKFLVLKHFELPEGVVGNVLAKCHQCQQMIAGSTKSTSNFRKHLQKKHHSVYITLDMESASATDSESEDHPTGTPRKMASVSNYFKKKESYSSTDPRQTRITDAVLMFIAGNLLPLKTVESPEFKDLCKKFDPRYVLPTRKRLSSKLLVEKSTSVQNQLKIQLSGAQNVCLTLDLWTNRQMTPFLGVTGHFISDWVLKSVMVACTRMKGRHTSENIRVYYEETLACYGIAGKIMCIVTDNASNMVKAFATLPGFPIEEQKSVDKDDSSSEESDEDDADDDDIGDNVDCETFESLSLHLPCYAHTLQLVVHDGLKQAGSHLKTVIAKATTLVGHVRRSIHFSELLSDEKRLQAHNLTRWNSQIIMIRSVISLPEKKLQLLETNFRLSAYKIKILKELCEILGPFEQATNLIQQQKVVTGSLPIMVTVEFQTQMRDLSGQYNNKMVKALCESITKRLTQYLELDHLKLATVLDLRFKLQWCTDSTLSDEIEQLLISKSNSVDLGCDEVEEPPPKQAKTGFFTIMNATPRKRNPSQRGARVSEYLEDPVIEDSCDPLQYWQKHESEFPQLAKLAAKYLAIQASSAAVERLFSIGGKIFRPDRCRLKDSTFEQLMMIRCHNL